MDGDLAELPHEEYERRRDCVEASDSDLASKRRDHQANHVRSPFVAAIQAIVVVPVTCFEAYTVHNVRLLCENTEVRRMITKQVTVRRRIWMETLPNYLTRNTRDVGTVWKHQIQTSLRSAETTRPTMFDQPSSLRYKLLLLYQKRVLKPIRYIMSDYFAKIQSPVFSCYPSSLSHMKLSRAIYLNHSNVNRVQGIERGG